MSTLVQRQRRGTLQRVGCCALGQLSQSPSWYLSVSKLGQTHLIFVDPGIKINGAYFRDVLLKQEMLPDIRSISGDFFIFQQHNAPAHRARETFALLQREVPAFIAPNLWPPNSPDLNPVDFP